MNNDKHRSITFQLNPDFVNLEYARYLLSLISLWLVTGSASNMYILKIFLFWKHLCLWYFECVENNGLRMVFIADWNKRRRTFDMYRRRSVQGRGGHTIALV